MAKKMLIDATHAEETRVVVVDGNKVEEFDFESENKRQLAGNIYLAKVTRVEPSLQAAFVDYGGNRHGFLAFSEIHPDYYQIPVADREALMEEERAYVEALRAQEEAEEEKPRSRSRRSRSRSKTSAEKVLAEDAVETSDVQISGMETIDLAEGEEGAEPVAIVPAEEGVSPMERVAETPVAEPGEGGAAEEAEQEAEVLDASDKDDSIESVAEEDESEDIRPPRKPRPRRYKIQEVIKVRQIMLVQVVKEERGNKGAALTTYLSLAGRYCVLMPNTARGGGISRKITNAADRKMLKQIAAEIDVPPGAGLIIRTAGANRTKAEIKRDYEYLQRLWEQIRDLTLKSIAPAKIYEEGDLIKRSIRDLYSREIDEVLVEGERGYRTAKDFMKMIMPSHAKNVKKYEDPLPLFARFQVESYLAGMFNPVVQLPSGGYIVIGVTEALVAIDVNSGRATKKGSIEETALQTNLEAAEEVARQLRLRDLAGLIVIDFIDMEERKNNAAVEKRLKDKLKTDRARIQMGRISGFGLLEMSRQRLRPGMLEASTQPCPACHGTGLIRSDDSLALSILRQLEEEGTRRKVREVLVRCPVSIANFLMNQKREHIAQIEARYGLSVRIEGDMHLVSPDFTIEKFKTATRRLPAPAEPVVSVDSRLMEEIDAGVAPEEEEVEVEVEAVEAAEAETEGETKPKKRRRRRRRRSSKSKSDTQAADAASTEEGGAPAEAAEEAADVPASDAEAVTEAPEGVEPVEAAPEAVAETAETEAPAEAAEEPVPARKTRSRAPRSRKSSTRSPKAAAVSEEPAAEAAPAEIAAETSPVAEVNGTPVEQPAPETAQSGEATATAAVAQPAEPVEVAAPDAQAQTAQAQVTKEVTEEVTPEAEVTEQPAATEQAEQPETAETATKAAVEPEAEAEAEAPTKTEAAMETEAQSEEAQSETEAEAAQADKSKRRGWWSLGR